MANINTYRVFNENDYNNLKLLLSNLLGSELDEKVCDERRKANLMNLSDIFEMSSSQEIIRIISNFCTDRNLIDKIRNFSQNLRNLEVTSWGDGICRDVIQCLARLYNMIFNHISEDIRFKILEKYFIKCKSTIDRETNDIIRLLEDKKSEVSKLCTKLEQDLYVNEEHLFNKVEKTDNLIKNIEVIHSNFLTKQREFETELQSKHNNFQKDIEEQLQDIQDGVYRKELAGYFLEERKSLKGEVNVRSVIFLFIIIISIMVTITSGNDTLSWLKDDVSNKTLKMIVVAFVVYVITFFGFDMIGSKSTKGLMNFKWLCTPYWGWLGATFIGMCSIFVVAYIVFVSSKDVSYINIISKRMPLFMILIWFTWFCSKQFSYTKQICDEYEYKYLLSMSYLGYKNEAKEMGDEEQSKALLITLLDSVIKNIATSPIQCVKSDCHTPFSEVLGAMKVNFGKDGSSN